MPKSDYSRLLHMRDAANDAIEFASGKTPADLEADRMRALALARCFEVIGEAATSVSAPYKAAHPEIPWRIMAAMRNRLIHAYFEINLKTVLDTAQVELPPLITAIRNLIDDFDPHELSE